MTSSMVVKLPNWMGDILFSFDLLYTLSQHYDRLCLVTSADHAELLSVFPIPRATVISYARDAWPYLERDTINDIRSFDADEGLILPNSIGSALLFRFAGVKRLRGYNTENRGFLLEKHLCPPLYNVHQTEYYLRLLDLWGFSAMPYPRTENDGPKDSTVVIHPGASKIPRAWHLERFLEVAGHVKELGFEPIFVSGDPINVEPFEARVKPSLTDFAKMLSRCRLFIGNDSGPLHLAQQCGAPVIAIYGPGDPKVTGPRPITSSRTIYHSFPCSPCRQKFFHECSPAPTGKPFCIETITSGEVLRAIRELLE